MSESATDILRRGFALTVANWPLIALRIVESLLMVGLAIAAVVAIIVPIAVSAGLGNFSDVPGFVEGLLEHWIVIVYALGVVAVLLLVVVAMHSFIDGATARVLVDSERAAALPAFDMQRWLSGGAASWWPIFWIYNAIWSIAGIVLLVPLCATLAGMFVVTANGPRIAIGCLGLLLTVVVLLPVGVIAGVWTQKSIAVCLARSASGTDSMRIARQEIRADLGRHVLVAFIVMVVSFGGAGAISTLGFPASMANHGQPLSFGFFAPLQIALSVAQSIFSAAVGTWFLASFVALTEER